MDVILKYDNPEISLDVLSYPTDIQGMDKGLYVFICEILPMTPRGTA